MSYLEERLEAGLGGVGEVFGAITGSTAAAEAMTTATTEAAQVQAESTREQIDFQKWLWGEQQQMAAPFVQAGEQALGQYQQAISQPFTGADVTSDPGYQFRLSEGLRGVEGSAAARGMQLSGRTLKGLGRYAQDYASAEFQNAYARRQQGISNLYNLASMGQAAAAGTAQQGGIMGGNITAAMQQGAGAQSQMYQNLGQIQAAQAQAPFQSMMQIGGLAALGYGTGMFGGSPTLPGISPMGLG